MKLTRRVDMTLMPAQWITYRVMQTIGDQNTILATFTDWEDGALAYAAQKIETDARYNRNYRKIWLHEIHHA